MLLKPPAWPEPAPLFYPQIVASLASCSLSHLPFLLCCTRTRSSIILPKALARRDIILALDSALDPFISKPHIYPSCFPNVCQIQHMRIYPGLGREILSSLSGCLMGFLGGTQFKALNFLYCSGRRVLSKTGSNSDDTLKTISWALFRILL
ncbi:hypothetical protein B0H13DRAFT_1025529 [Mycena leptocephala]|nr:hypothetical protein B0H13DRAFT_1025529 [Mycena leptocephala]